MRDGGVIAAVAGTGILLSLSVLTWCLVRLALKEAERTRKAVASLPWNDLTDFEAEDCRPFRARVGGIVATGDEMLIEVRTAPSNDCGDPEVVWLIGPTNVAAIVALSRWRDDRAIVTIDSGPTRLLVYTDQARVSFTGRVPTA
jgi:hypothetical protein